MNFILFNGPPRSGKDTAAKIAFDHINQRKTNILYPVWEKFSFPNKRAFAGIMGTECNQWGYVPFYEDHKEDVIPSLGVSYRQWQIDVSEKFMKPLYGNDVFGRLLLNRSYPTKSFIHVVSDCGFQIECDVLKDHNVLLFQLYREGCSFENDSREYVFRPTANWGFDEVWNNNSLDQLKNRIESTVDLWLK